MNAANLRTCVCGVLLVLLSASSLGAQAIKWADCNSASDVKGLAADTKWIRLKYEAKAGDLGRLSELKQLERIALCSGTVSPDVIATFPSIKTLDVTMSCVVTDKVFKEIGTLTSLEELNVDIGLDEVKNWKPLKDLKVRRLTMGHSYRRDSEIGRGVFAAVCAISTIESLSIFGSVEKSGQAEMDVLATLPALTSLGMSGCCPSAATFKSLFGQGVLSSLSIGSAADMEDDCFKEVASCAALKTVHVQGCIGFTDAGLNYLADCKSLTMLSVAECPLVSQEAADRIKGKLAECNVMIVAGEPDKYVDIDGLTELSKLPATTRRIQVRNVSVADLSKLLDFDSLLGLSLTIPKTSGETPKKDSAAIAKLFKSLAKKHSGLMDLTLHAYNAQNDVIKAIAEFSNLRMLHIIGMAEMSSKTLKPLSKLKELTEIHMPRTGNAQKDDSGILESLAKIESLTVIDWTGYKGTAEGFKKLKDIPRLKRLEFQLMVNLDDDVLEAVAEIPTLEYVQLRTAASASKVTDDGIEKLASLTNAEWLLIEAGPTVTDGAINALKAKLPKVKIYPAKPR
ncbi:MAG: hypothetical protein KDB29_06850 [Planctomycetes bacterium]|nr:hypothetical protein [Planctomycetota bacterium]